MAEPLSFMGGLDDLQEKYELIPIYYFKSLNLRDAEAPNPGLV